MEKFDMDVQAVLDLQYETQHFGFHPRDILDRVYDVFFENVSLLLNELKNHMIQEFERHPPNVIQAQTESIHRRIAKLCDKAIDKLEVYLTSNIFSIPKYAVLPEDIIHIKNPCTKEDDEKLDKEVEELRQKIIMEKAKKHSLKRKIQEQKHVKEYLQSFQKELTTLINVATQNGVNEENIESLYSNLFNVLNCDILCSKSDP